MQKSLTYIKEKAPPADIPGQPTLATFAELEAQAAAQSAGTEQAEPADPAEPTQQQVLPALSAEEFNKDIRELSRELVIKEQQLELLIACLPGLHTSEQQQVERMKELEAELKRLEGERLHAVKERMELVRKVEGMIGRVGRMR